VSRADAVHGLLVVVPARDEESLIGACLASVSAAVATAQAAYPDLVVQAVVVADRCSDRTADLAEAAGVRAVRIEAGNVGAARGAGVATGLALLPGLAAQHVWVASTDADTRVPPTWLTEHLDLAHRGIGLVLGRAVPDALDLDAATLQRWHDRHTSTVVGVHVHGANLGFRADGYLAVGGWPPVPEHEDQLLVAALVAAGLPMAAGPDVTTSGRLRGRSPGGFAGYLVALAETT
jgi:glycosyltransferase involved in cell wall biosynthesis